jgi:hypothetical protein
MDDIGPLTNTKNRLKKTNTDRFNGDSREFFFFPPSGRSTEQNRQEQQGQSVSESREGGE